MNGHPSVTRNSWQERLYKYADEAKKAEKFTDVTIKSGDTDIPAHRLVLASYSKVFEKLFQSPMREQYLGIVELNEFSEETVKMVVDFMYTRTIHVKYENVFDLLATAHYLQITEVCEFCFDYLKTAITIETWSAILATARLYDNKLLSEKVYQFMCTNLKNISSSEHFKKLLIDDLTAIVNIGDRTNFTEISKYNAFVSWLEYDKSKRQTDFLNLFLLIELHKLPCPFLENIVAGNPLVSENNKCLHSVMAAITKQFKELSLRDSGSKLLAIGGQETKSKILEVYNIFLKSNCIYPDLPQPLLYSKAVQMNKSIFILGGAVDQNLQEVSNKMYGLRENNSEWKVIAGMNEKRCLMGATFFNDCLVVGGGVSSGWRRLQSAELYVPALNTWQRISDLKSRRSSGELVACNDCLYALGGYNGSVNLSSVERFDGHSEKKWEYVKPMNSPRSLFAAVTCDNKIFAIGGQCLDDQHRKIKLSTVEKYDPSENQWSYVSSLNHARDSHAACLMDGKIFVVGGGDENRDYIKFIECYDPTSDEWSVVGEVDAKLARHSLVSL